MVFNGVTRASLKGAPPSNWELYKDHAGREGHTATVTFQPSHFSDGRIMKEYLEWLKKQFPPKTIVGLTLDHAGPHISEETKFNI